MSTLTRSLVQHWFTWGWICGAAAGLCVGCLLTAFAFYSGTQAA